MTAHEIRCLMQEKRNPCNGASLAVMHFSVEKLVSINNAPHVIKHESSHLGTLSRAKSVPDV